MVTRRLLLQGAGAGAMLFLTGKKRAFAQSTSSRPLYIMVQATGGWDPTILMDPKIGTQFNNTFSAADIQQAGGLRFAPRRGNGNLELYEVGAPGSSQSFFHKYASQLMVINGVDTQTNSHDIGPRHIFSGNSRDDVPAFAALYASVQEANIGAQLPFGFLANGGYVETRGLLPTSQTGDVSPVLDLSLPNFADTYDTAPDEPFFTAPALARLHQAEADRLARRQATGLLPRVRKSLQQMAGARAVERDFAPIFDGIRGLPAVPAHLEQDYTVDNARLVMAAMAADVCASATLTPGFIFDTHFADHDTEHPRVAGDLFHLIDYLWETATTLGFADRLTIIVGSDFGRTTYNDDGGKDHWPITSMMLMGRGIPGGVTIGETTDDTLPDGEPAEGHVALPIKLDGGQLVTAAADDPSGFLLRPGYIHQALRRHAGIATHANALRYPLATVPAEPIPLFG